MPSVKKRPIQRRKLSEIVFDQLLVMIEEEGLMPGDQMPTERELMVTFGVGRPVVREAMQRLNSMGMISIQHGERARITQVDVNSLFDQIDPAARHLLASSTENVDHLKQARLFLETGLVRIAAEKANDNDILRLKEVIEKMRSYRDTEGFIPTDMEFHLEIARITGNPIYIAVTQAILQWMADFRRDMLRFKGQETSILEHEEIVSYIEARDSDGAMHAMHDHLLGINLRSV